MKIKEMPLFHTFRTQDDLLDYFDKFTRGERVLLITAMGLTWNLLAHIINVEDENEDGRE